MQRYSYVSINAEGKREAKYFESFAEYKKFLAKKGLVAVQTPTEVAKHLLKKTAKCTLSAFLPLIGAGITYYGWEGEASASTKAAVAIGGEIPYVGPVIDYFPLWTELLARNLILRSELAEEQRRLKIPRKLMWGGDPWRGKPMP